MESLAPDLTFALPENCAVRLIDLDVRVGGLLSVGEDGFINIYLNARLSRDQQLRALRHELAHYARDDLYSDADIREAERAADAAAGDAAFRALDGTPLHAPAGFDPSGLRRVGRGLYLPVGANLARAAEAISELAAALRDALKMVDVLQTPPLLPVERLEALVAGLSPADIAFVGWPPPGDEALPAVMQLCRDDGLRAAVYYDADGRPDNALATLECAAEHAFRVILDLRRRRGRLEAFAIHREVDGQETERLY